MIETTIAIVLVVALALLEIMDRYSTETLLNLNVLWHENSGYRKGLEELRLKTNPLNAEKNLWVRALIKRYGIHRGLTHASWITCIVLGYLMGAIMFGTISQRLDAGHLAIYAMITFFMLGLIFRQFIEAVSQKRGLKKIRNDEEEYNF